MIPQEIINQIIEKVNIADLYPEKVAELDSLMKISRVNSDLFRFQ